MALRCWLVHVLLTGVAGTTQARTPLFVQEVSERDLLRTAINPVVRNEYRVIPNLTGLVRHRS